MRIYNIREGFSDIDDALPKRMSAPRRSGNLHGIAVDSATLLEMQRLYYQILGWNEHGIPTMSRLVELDIEWAAVTLTAK